MLDVLARNWWAFALRGVVAILLGIFAFVDPGATLVVVIIVFGAYALVDGVFSIVAAIRAARAHERWGQLLLVGICGIVVAAIVWFYPGLAALSLLYVIAAWALITGVFEIMGAFKMRELSSGWWWWLIAGAASVLFGILLAWRPGAGILTLLWLLGAYAIAFGIFMLGFAWRLYALSSREKAPV